LQRAAMEGDVVHGSVMAGQVSGMIHDVVPAAEVLRRTVAQAEAVLASLTALIVKE
jgi:enoyl-[acyl-carrier protein] reductase II